MGILDAFGLLNGSSVFGGLTGGQFSQQGQVDWQQQWALQQQQMTPPPVVYPPMNGYNGTVTVRPGPKQKRPETDLEWLDRRVAEVCVAL